MELKIKHPKGDIGNLRSIEYMAFNIVVLFNDDKAIVVPKRSEVKVKESDDSLILFDGNLRDKVVVISSDPNKLRSCDIQFYCSDDFYKKIDLKDFAIFKLTIYD